jgi:hypothetical protein
MSNTAKITWNDTMGRWEAAFNGQILASRRDFLGGTEYLRRAVEGGFNLKAKRLNVTKVMIIEPVSSANSQEADFVDAEGDEETIREEDVFPINERFAIMEDYIDMVAHFQLASTIVTGEGGLGKSFTVMRTLSKNGLRDVGGMDTDDSPNRGFVVVKGFSTAKGLFRTLYENRNRIVVFDDADSVLRDVNAVNILKAAVDSYDKRVVTWNAESSFGGDDDLPKSFEFKGGVIFISNMPKHKIPQALRSRAMCADVSMTRSEVIERMRVIIESDEFMPEFELEHKIDALEFIAENANNPAITELNLRSLVNVVKARAAKPDTWKRMGLYSMINS